MERPDAPFADTLRRAMAAENVTQEELAVRSGLTQSAISKILRDATRDPKLSTVRALERALPALQKLTHAA